MPTPVPFALAALPPAPTGRCPEVRRACRYLKATHASVSALLDTFNLVRTTATIEKRSSRGRLSRDQVDLLRAAIVFTGGGLDAVCQRLVYDSIGKLIDRGGTAAEKFDGYVRGELYALKPSNELITAVTSSDPRDALIDAYRTAKTRQSFQGSSDVRDRVAKLLGIPDNVLRKSRFDALNSFFAARNDIVHQLDYKDINGTSTARNHRTPEWTIAQCNRVLLLLADLINATASLVK